MQPRPIEELATEHLEAARGGEGMPDIGGLLNSAFGMAEQAGAPSKELGMAKQAAGGIMPIISSFLGGGSAGGDSSRSAA